MRPGGRIGNDKMKEYLRRRHINERNSTLAGLALTVLVVTSSGIAVSGSGLKYLDPPPAEVSFVVDFTADQEEVPEPPRIGREPRSTEVDKTSPIELVQESKSPYADPDGSNLTPQTSPDDFGDVETEHPEPEQHLDPRASFPGMARHDTSLTAPHMAREAESTFRAGQPDGNTHKGRTDGTPNAHLKGRKTVGTIPRPAYNVQEYGVVVMDIRVDKNGTVVSAVVGDGTTTNSKDLINAARKAAMETHFNVDGNAPSLQEGTITYTFRLISK